MFKIEIGEIDYLSDTIIDTDIHIAFENQFFPDDYWSDTTIQILTNWIYNLKMLKQSSIGTARQFAFFDGPYWLIVTRKTDQNLDVQGIHGMLHKDEVEISFQIAFCDFINEIRKAILTYQNVLTKQTVMTKAIMDSITQCKSCIEQLDKSF